MSAHLRHCYRQQRALPPPIWGAREHFYPSSPLPSCSSATTGALSYLVMIILHIRPNLQGKTLVKVVVRRSLIPHTKSPKGFSPHHIALGKHSQCMKRKPSPGSPLQSAWHFQLLLFLYIFSGYPETLIISG